MLKKRPIVLDRLMATTTASQGAWKTGSSASRSTGPKPCIPPRSCTPSIGRPLRSAFYPLVGKRAPGNRAGDAAGAGGMVLRALPAPRDDDTAAKEGERLPG